MYQYVVKRMLLMIPTLIGAALLVFFLLRLLPGDVCEVRLAGSGLFVSQEAIDICREDLGLDDPLYSQFIDFVGGYFTGDLGKSMWTGQPVTHEIQVRFKLSLQLAIMTTLVAVIIALPLGIISAVKQNTWIDYVVRAFSIAGIGIPSFWLSASWSSWGCWSSPRRGSGRAGCPPSATSPRSRIRWATSPSSSGPRLATGYRYSAVATRMTRSAMLEVLRRGLRADRAGEGTDRTGGHQPACA